MELALEVKFYIVFHWVTRPWWRTLTKRKWRQIRISADQRKWRQIRILLINGSDVEYLFPQRRTRDTLFELHWLSGHFPLQPTGGTQDVFRVSGNVIHLFTRDVRNAVSQLPSVTHQLRNKTRLRFELAIYLDTKQLHKVHKVIFQKVKQMVFYENGQAMFYNL